MTERNDQWENHEKKLSDGEGEKNKEKERERKWNEEVNHHLLQS